jgi:pimeloyl-ACP methyl ester carboxylesterase
MHTVTSRDGARIAFWSSGEGKPLLLVHGTTADHTTTWRYVGPALERRFTVHAMDRRGRGGSGDGPAYDLQREAEDVAAVVDAIGGPINVLGHSHGALCAIEAALLTTNLRRLILYEGVCRNGADLVPHDFIDRLDAMLKAGDVGGVLVALLMELVGCHQPRSISCARSPITWAVRLAMLPPFHGLRPSSATGSSPTGSGT